MTTQPTYLPDSGELIWLDLDPRTGHEQSGRRPCLVLSDKEFSHRTGMAIICPVTSRPRGLLWEVKLPDTKTQGVVLPVHVKSVDLAARYPKFIEQAPDEVVRTVRDYVKVIIGAG